MPGYRVGERLFVNPVRIVIIAKAPIASFAKTRLIPSLGAHRAADLAGRMLRHTVANALEAKLDAVELCVTPDVSDAAWATLNLPVGLQWSAQGEGDLGLRMARAAQRCSDRSESVLLIGTDCPALSVNVLRSAAKALDDHEAAVVPTYDGGYALLGLNRFDAALFSDIPWSTNRVAAMTLDRIRQLGWRTQALATQHDIDEPADLQWLPKSWGYSG